MHWFVSAFTGVAVMVAAGSAAGKPLSNVLVVIDPGHGGLDDGASGRVNGRRVVEDEHVYDVALRLWATVRAAGGTPFLTVVDPKQLRPRTRPGHLTADRNERVIGGGCTPLTAGTRCLQARINAAARAARQRRYRRIVWISLHFDVGRPVTEGAVIIVPSSGPTPAARAIEQALGAVPSRLRTSNGALTAATLRSGDREHGIRRLYVLSGRNSFRERMLIELGNFRNTNDLWRIRDPQVRQDYADRIARGLIRWVTSTGSQSPVATARR